MRYTSYLSCVFLMVFSTLNAHAQDDYIICTTVATRWSGDETETNNIEKNPIPQSYRSRFESDGCERIQLITRGLLDWHFAYGSRTSTAAVLQYFEDKSFVPDNLSQDRGIIYQVRWDAVLSAWNEAQFDKQKYGKVKKKTQRNLDKQITVFQEIIKQSSSHWLAGFYLEAAEFYGDTVFLERAEILLRPALYHHRFFHTKVEEMETMKSVIKRHFIPEYRDYLTVQDMLYRIYNMRLGFGQLVWEEDIFKVDSISPEKLKAYEQAGDFVSQNWHDYDEGIPKHNKELLIEIEQEDDEDIFIESLNYWRNKAHENFLSYDPKQSKRFDGSAFHYAVALTHWFRNSGGDLSDPLTYKDGIRRGFKTNDDLVALYIAKAKFHALKTLSEKENYRIIGTYIQALDMLEYAANLAPVHRAPNRYKQIAYLYMDYASKIEILDDKNGLGVYEQRLVHNFKLILADLER